MTKAMPRIADSVIATCGVRKRVCTSATLSKNRRSSAIAKKMRGPVRIEPFSVPNVEIITVADTNTTPE